MNDNNRRETGGRKLSSDRGPDPADAFSRDAAKNKPPKTGVGLTEPSGDVNEKTRHYDGQQPSSDSNRDKDQR
jgi:hypothetical protein